MNVVKQHLFPFLLALVVCFLLVRSGRINSFAQPAAIHTAISKATYYPYFTNDLNTEIWLRSHLKNRTVVVLGSSELSAQSNTYIPNKFLTDSMHIPCIAFGKAGNQCFNIFCQLLSFNKDLTNARVVIFLSPGWFDGYSDGTSAELFLLYNNRRTLGYILEDDSIPEEFKNYIGKYVNRHFSSINAPDETLLSFYYSGKQTNSVNKIATAPFAAFHRFCLDKRNDLYREAYADHGVADPNQYVPTNELTPWRYVNDEFRFHAMDWNKLGQKELAAFNLSSSRNTAGVENDYYDAWVRGRAFKPLKNLSLEESTEYQDFLMLMNLLHYYKADAYFIIQGLNPYVLTSSGNLDHTITAIESEIEERNYKYYNMFTSSKEKYVKGTLNDIMHTGEYGWLKIDSAIVHHYFKPY